jgi:hypothetical protein
MSYKKLFLEKYITTLYNIQKREQSCREKEKMTNTLPIIVNPCKRHPNAAAFQVY